MIIEFAKFPPGHGKTHAGISRSVTLSKLENRSTLWVQPTKVLIDATIANYTENNLQFRKLREEGKVIAIHGDNIPVGEVIETIIDTLLHAQDGSVVFITNNAFLDLPNSVVTKRSWDLIIDEVFDPTYYASHDFHEVHHAEICSLLTLDATTQVGDYILLKSNKKIREIHTNKSNDTYWQMLKDVTRKINSEHFDVYLNIHEYDKFFNKELNEENRLSIKFYGIAKTSIIENFRSVTILAADIETSILKYNWGRKQNVTFQDSPIKLTRPGFDHSDKLTFLYVIDNKADKRNWSEYTKRKLISKDQTYNDFVLDAYYNEFKDKPHLVVANNSERDKRIVGERLKVIAHGLNEYDTYNRIAFLPALNPNPQFEKFQKEVCGIDPEEIYVAKTVAIAYQDIMRTCLRRPNCNQEVEVFVADKRLAQELQRRYFQNSKMRKIGVNLPTPARNNAGRPKTGVAMTPTERSQKSRMLAKLSKLTGRTYPIDIAAKEVITCNDNSLISCIGNYRCIYTKNLYSDIYSNTPISDTCNKNEYLALLGEATNAEYKNKEDNTLIAQAQFLGVGRTRADVKQVEMLILDNDGGELSPAEFMKLFSWEMHIYNTWTSSQEKCKYRVYIPLTRFINTDEYFHITDYIRSKLPEKHGFDNSAFRPEAIFYLPCKSNFGIDFALHQNTAELDVEETLKMDVPKQQRAVELTLVQKTQFNEKRLFKIKTLTNQKRETRIMAALSKFGNGLPMKHNDNYFRFAASLFHLGLDMEECKTELIKHVDQFGVVRDRLKNIHNMLKKLYC